MSTHSFVPEKEALRRAVAWLAEQGTWTSSLIEQACLRFDVSPEDEEFLLREFRRRQEPGQA
jgi:hypothetical protein